MELTCNGASHCIMHENIAFHGWGAWLELNTAIGDLMGGFGTVGRSPTKSHGCMKRKTCVE